MPRLPRILGNLMEFMFTKVNVDSTEMTGPNLKTVRFKGTFPNVKFKTGQAIIIRVDDTNYRNYTPSAWDSDSGTFDVIFHIHGNGPGSHFIENLKSGDQVSIGLPRGFNIYRQAEKYHFFFGDESCISVFKSLKDQINYDNNNYLGVLELDNASFGAPEKLGLAVDIVSKSEKKAEFAINALNKLESSVWELWRGGVFYLMGNARSIQTFTKALKEKGVQSKNIYSQPFWVEGKTGL